MGMVVLVDVLCTIIDIDARAAEQEASPVVEILGHLCLATYTLEFIACVFVKGKGILKDRDGVIDIVIMTASYAELTFMLAQVNIEEVSILRMLRVARVMRLLRFIRRSPALKELRKLMMMFASCVKTLIWSFIFCGIMMTCWSMAAVELIHPIVVQMTQEGAWDDCESCRSAFSSVMRSNLTLFKTVLAGDSWGLMAEPIAIKSPLAMLIFAGVLISLVFGILNLIVAVVVDAAVEQRQKDVVNIAAELDADAESDFQELTKIFSYLDADGNGELTLEELMVGARGSSEFQSRLRVMDIDQQDLEQLFFMLDEDQGGTISLSEFTNALSRWMTESRTANRFVKYNVMKLVVEQKNFQKLLKSLQRKIDRLETASEANNVGEGPVSLRNHMQKSAPADTDMAETEDFSRRRDEPFWKEDSKRLEEFATPAANILSSDGELSDSKTKGVSGQVIELGELPDFSLARFDGASDFASARRTKLFIESAQVAEEALVHSVQKAMFTLQQSALAMAEGELVKLRHPHDLAAAATPDFTAAEVSGEFSALSPGFGPRFAGPTLQPEPGVNVDT